MRCSGCGRGWLHLPDLLDMHGLGRAICAGLNSKEGCST